jgi:hypothetical protein
MATVNVDDTDPSVIYSPSLWFSQSTTLAYNDTEKWTFTGGAKATISFVGELFNPPQEATLIQQKDPQLVYMALCCLNQVAT